MCFPRRSTSAQLRSCCGRPAAALSESSAVSSPNRRRCTMASDNRLSRHVHGFFHEYLTTQRNVSPHTVFSYRDTLKLFLSYASQQLSTPVVDLNLDALTPDLVLRLLNHLDPHRSNTAATRNVRLAALRVLFRHAGAHDPVR